MRKSLFPFVLLMILISHNGFSKSQERSDFYYIVNNSSEDLLVTVLNRSITTSWDIMAGDHVDLFTYEGIVNRVYMDRSFKNGDYVLLNHFLPHQNRYIDARYYWKYTYFFRRRTPEHMDNFDRDPLVRSYGRQINEQFPTGVTYEYLWFSGMEVLDLFINDFIVTDINGNIIFTLDDIDESFFEENVYATHIEEYTEDFYDLPGFRAFGFRNEENYETAYGIFITDELIQSGRR